MKIYPAAVIYKTNARTVRVRRLCSECLEFVRQLPQVDSIDVGRAITGECEKLNGRLCLSEGEVPATRPRKEVVKQEDAGERLPLDYLARQRTRRYVLRRG